MAMEKIHLERYLRQRVAEVMESRPEEVCLDSSIHRLGLDSMSLVGLAADVEKFLGKPVDIDLVFGVMTLRELIDVLLPEADQTNAK